MFSVKELNGYEHTHAGYLNVGQGPAETSQWLRLSLLNSNETAVERTEGEWGDGMESPQVSCPRKRLMLLLIDFILYTEHRCKLNDTFTVNKKSVKK